MMAAFGDSGICFLQFGSSHRVLQSTVQAAFPLALVNPCTARHRDTIRDLEIRIHLMLEGGEETKRPTLELHGTAFQKAVWVCLQTIPSGEVRSYSEVAEAIGRPRAVRAVASACAGNNIALLIPCHRVIGASGALGGYRWGLNKKASLLKAEERGLMGRYRQTTTA